jgi:vacuolar-type H+-ATPase subunit E/Vma4
MSTTSLSRIRSPGTEPTGADGLEPVRAHLLAAARRDAAETVARAEAAASTTVDRARAEVGAIRTEARTRGQADGVALAATAQAGARREGRELVLRAQRDCYLELRARSRDAVVALRAEPGYPRLLARLRELAGTAAGPDAVVAEHSSGGAVAESAHQRVDCSLITLADRALDALGSEVVDLWT